MRDGVREAFESKTWAVRDGVPRSGTGSTLAATARLRQALPDLLARHGVRSFLDAPCGDWFWMKTLALGDVDYIGGDISAEVVAAVDAEHGAPNRRFMHLDITSDPLPQADMMICRDCLFHLKWWLRWKFFENLVESGIPLLLLTMHHVLDNRRVTRNGGFAKFNPCAAPFHFSAPLEMIHEGEDFDLDPAFLATGPGRKQRSLGLWSRDQVSDALAAHKASAT